jgi:hypothetical protein
MGEPADTGHVVLVEWLAAVDDVQDPKVVLVNVELDLDLSASRRAVGVVGVLEQFIEEAILILGLDVGQRL